MRVLSKEKVFKNLINNEWVESSSQETIKSISPLNKENVVGYVQNSKKEDLEKIVNAAHEAKRAWRKVGQAARGEYLFKVANILEENLNDIAETMTKEKWVKHFQKQKEKPHAVLQFFATMPVKG